MKRVVIIGMGFGGIRAARVLAGKGLDVVLVDRNNYHLFQPLLYQVGTAGLEQESIAYPVRAMAREWRGTRFHLAEVAGVDFPAREVVTGNGRIPYDYLIIGAGSVTNYFGLESVERHAFDLKELVDGERLRNHILTAFERAVVEPDPAKRRALMTFVIVGGGPTGVEFAGALMELVRYVLAKDYPELSVQAARVVLVEAFDRLLAAMPQELQVYTLEKLRAMGVEVLWSCSTPGWWMRSPSGSSSTTAPSSRPIPSSGRRGSRLPPWPRPSASPPSRGGGFPWSRT